MLIDLIYVNTLAATQNTDFGTFKSQLKYPFWWSKLFYLPIITDLFLNYRVSLIFL